MEALKINSETTIASFVAPQMKKCKCCGKLKPLSDFRKNTAFKDELDNTCRECRRQQEQTKRKNNSNVKKKVQNRESKRPDGSLKLKDFTLDELTMELRSRGYAGELRRITTVTI